MAETDTQSAPEKNAGAAAAKGPSSIRIHPPGQQVDYITIGGLFIALGLIASALVVGGSPQAFLNPAALMIVLGGTLAVTAVSYAKSDLAKLGRIIFSTLIHPSRAPRQMAMQLMDLAVVARQRGVLALGDHMDEMKKDPDLHKAFEYVIDGFETDKIYMILQQELDSATEISRKSSGILRRAAEVAPAMGLIGTLVGLVQMLSVLKEPDNIGPAMAIALLTTFYGALLGTVVISPLAAKVERNSNQDALIKSMILTTVLSISHQENPRQLELQLNALLPPDERIIYFST